MWRNITLDFNDQSLPVQAVAINIELNWQKPHQFFLKIWQNYPLHEVYLLTLILLFSDLDHFSRFKKNQMYRGRKAGLPDLFYLCPVSHPATDTDILEVTAVETKTANPYQLIVWNDDVNTFEWVIETLVEVCGHTYEQAEQCAYIIHFNGKYAVKEGEYEDLRPKCDAILDRGINATIEVIV